MERKLKELLILVLAPVALAMALMAAGISLAGASTSGAREYSHSIKKTGSTSFTIYVRHPRKVTLFPEMGSPLTVSYSTACDTNGVTAFKSRTFTTGYTRNLLYQIPKGEEECWITIAGASNTHRGQIVVDVMN